VTLSHTWEVEAVHNLLLATKMCKDDGEISIQAASSLLNIVGPNDPLFSFNVLLQLQGAHSSNFFQKVLGQGWLYIVI
jgi:hypothetical protein